MDVKLGNEEDGVLSLAGWLNLGMPRVNMALYSQPQMMLNLYNYFIA